MRTNGRHAVRRFACALLLASSAFAQDAAPTPTPEPFRRDPEVVRIGRETQDRRTAVLTGHGVGVSVADLLAFLEAGFSADAVARGLPQEPVVKAEVVNAAIQELGFRQDRAAVPALVEILSGRPPRGVASIVAADTEKLSLTTRDQTRETYLRYTRFNALVALGLIGDRDALLAVREAVEGEEGYSFAIEGSTTLGMLGDGSGLKVLEPYLADPAGEQLARAFESVFYLTGRNYALTENSSLGRRREAVAQFRDWYAANGATFAPERADVLRRRAGGVAHEEIPVSSLRGALRASRRFGDFDVRWSARQYLQRLGPGAAPDLKAVAEDSLEDVDIRIAALEWYAAADPRGARRPIKDLRTDENPAVAAAADRLLADIDEAVSERK